MVANRYINYWIVIQSKDSHYADIEGRCYEYPSHIQNAQRIRPGDILVITLPKSDAPDERRIIGIAHIGQIRRISEGMFVAYYDRHKELDPAATFEEIGGDPRRNPRMSMNKVDREVVDRLLKREGLSSVEELPSVAIDIEVKEIPPEHELREELHKAVVEDLLGPARGLEEEIVGTSVRDRYLVGKIAPRRVPADAAASEDRNRGGDTGTEDDRSDEGETAHESLMPSSFGMTFCVDGDVDLLEVEATWGVYERVDSASVVDEAGLPKKAWKRSPAGGAIELPLVSGSFGPLVTDPDREGVFLRGLVREPEPTGERTITLFLVNDQEEPEKGRDVAWVFQPRVIVRASDDSAVFMSRHTREVGSGDEERAALAMLYRNQVEFAIGHGVSVHAEVAEETISRAVKLRTEFVPSYDVPKTEVPTPNDIPEFTELVRDMKELSELEKKDLVGSLRVLTGEYTKWIAQQEERIDSGELQGFETQAREALVRCKATEERLEEGIRVLERDDKALAAFRFANRAMWLQRIRSIYSLKRRRGEEADLDEIDNSENRSWYPFQLAFILLGIPSLTDPTHSDRTEGGAAVADLLWFPTGGGKTEAYLGLAAFTMAIRRLQGGLGGLDASRGVAVIMRYTLRLLTIQQFQRASTLICAMEILRKKDKERQWGNTPFRLGLWVGQRATPNTTKDAEYAIQNAHGDSWVRRGTGTPQQLTNCPWCGSEINMGKGDLKCLPVKGNIGRTLAFCSHKYGLCEFSPAKSPDEGIPVVVVDEEIYRLLPAMIVGTVDKFAQMPRKGQVQTLFGRVSGECPRHGFISPDSEDKCSGNHRRAGKLPRTQRLDCSWLRPPDLVIQDEFHLISGPLGTLVGLYETAVDELASWTFEEKRIRPKVLASTATVRKAGEQTHGVFLRRVNVFPPHGLDIEDNFFAVQREVSSDKPGRRYIGICAPGMARPAVLIRVYLAFSTAAQRLRELYGAVADPWMTLVGYFNSLRELGGMRRLVEDDVRTRAFRVTLGDLERPGLAQRDIREVEELTSRASSTDIPRILDRLEEQFGDLDQYGAPLDVVLATNMISVGVDVQRLGLMVVNGQPKTTAEYIQATSRVGRRHPGLVCTVLNWSRPRDLSHYETFEHYHATFYQQVEAQSITPFAPRAVDRGLTGILASLVRLHDLDLNPNLGAGTLISTTDPHAKTAEEAITSRAWSVTEKTETRDLVSRALAQRVDEWVDEASQGGRELGYKGKKDGSTVGLLRSPGPHPWMTFSTPTSLREVEPPVALVLKTDIGRESAGWEAQKQEEKEEGENE